jgi:hypothetical protein
VVGRTGPARRLLSGSLHGVSIQNNRRDDVRWAHGRASTPLVELVRVAGVRWAIEMVFPQLAKGRMRAVG